VFNFNVENFIESVRRIKMKKLLVLALVLSVASMANASLVISVGSDLSSPATESITSTGTLSLGVWTNALLGYQDLTNAYYALVCDTTMGTIDIATGTDRAIGADAAVQLLSLPSQWGTSAATNAFFGLPTNFDGTEGAATPVNNVAGVAANTQLESAISYTASAVGAQTIELWISTDGQTNATMVGSIAVTQTPEPMTMALLGLGGLFIRRRK
jgi:hypothetical protein